MRPADQVFDANGLQQLEKVVASADAGMHAPEVQTALANPGSLGTKKDYRIHLASREFDLESPLIQLAIHPALLARVNGYLGMWSYLREVQIWLDMPTPGEAKETQLWHRDDDDHANVKAFIYLNAVTEGGGPFCFVPRTHVFGKLRTAVPPTAPGRMNDDQMAAHVPAAGWTCCTGSARTRDPRRHDRLPQGPEAPDSASRDGLPPLHVRDAEVSAELRAAARAGRRAAAADAARGCSEVRPLRMRGE